MKYQMNTLLWGIEITSYKLHLNLLQIVLYTKAPDTSFIKWKIDFCYWNKNVWIALFFHVYFYIGSWIIPIILIIFKYPFLFAKLWKIAKLRLYLSFKPSQKYLKNQTYFQPLNFLKLIVSQLDHNSILWFSKNWNLLKWEITFWFRRLYCVYCITWYILQY